MKVQKEPVGSVVTKQKAAQMLGITERQLLRLVADELLPHPTRMRMPPHDRSMSCFQLADVENLRAVQGKRGRGRRSALAIARQQDKEMQKLVELVVKKQRPQGNAIDMMAECVGAPMSPDLERKMWLFALLTKAKTVRNAPLWLEEVLAKALVADIFGKARAAPDGVVVIHGTNPGVVPISGLIDALASSEPVICLRVSAVEDFVRRTQEQRETDQVAGTEGAE